MDADLRRPRVAEKLGVESTGGLTCVLVVAYAELVRGPQVATTIQALEQVGATLLGFVVNGLEGRRGGGYGYGYGYRYKAKSDDDPVVSATAPTPAPARAVIPRLTHKNASPTVIDPCTGETERVRENRSR